MRTDHCSGFWVLAGLLSLSACSTTDSKEGDYIVSSLSPEEEVICKRQRPVGSHIPVTICRTRAQIQADQEAAMREVGPMRTMGGDESGGRPRN